MIQIRDPKLFFNIKIVVEKFKQMWTVAITETRDEAVCKQYEGAGAPEAARQS